MLLLKREGTWGSTLTLFTAVLVLVQLLVVFLLGVHGVNRLLSSQASLRLEVLPTAQDADIQDFFAAVHADESVSKVEFLTKDEAYAIERTRDPDLVAFLDQYKLDNPFSDTFVVTLASLDSYDAFRQFVEQGRWKSVINPSFLSSVTDQERQVRELLSVTEAIRSVTFVFIFVAFSIVLFVVLELVGRAVRAHDEELFLETMLGASPMSMLLPFIGEMTLLLLGGTLIATVVVVGCIIALPLLMPSLVSEVPFHTFASEMKPLLLRVFPWILVLELFLMPAIAYVGAFLGSGRKIVSPVAFFE
jgi:cell division protein FtsX